MAIDILNWRSEKSLTAYPFERGIGIEDFVIDANFVQFDGFVPILTKIVVTEHDMTLFIQFDKVLSTLVINDSVLAGDEYKLFDNTRYLGRLLIGKGVATVWIRYTDQTVTLNTKFLAALVRPIPSNCGVYAIQGDFGAVQLLSDDVISFDVTGNNVTFNAAALDAIQGANVLKTINGIRPRGNNLIMDDDEVLKISTDGSNLDIGLVDSSLGGIILDS